MMVDDRETASSSDLPRRESKNDATGTSSSLLRRAVSGDPTAWEKMSDQYGSMVRKRCLKAGLSSTDAECLSQEVFIELFLRLNQFARQRPGSFRRWFGMLIHSRIIDHIRKLRRRRERVADSTLQIATAISPATDSGIQPAPRHRELLEVIRHEFSHRDWEIFYQYVGLERPPDEIALEFNTTRNTVYLTKSRILRRLRETLLQGSSQPDAI